MYIYVPGCLKGDEGHGQGVHPGHVPLLLYPVEEPVVLLPVCLQGALVAGVLVDLPVLVDGHAALQQGELLEEAPQPG